MMARSSRLERAENFRQFGLLFWRSAHQERRGNEQEPRRENQLARSFSFAYQARPISAAAAD